MKKVFFAIIIYLTASLSIAHDADESRVSIEAELQSSYNAGAISYMFQLFDDKSQKTIAEADLLETHTKILHLIVYDPSRNEFNHVHPTFAGKMWFANLNLTTNGNYFVWVQGELLDGTEFTTFTKAQVVNGKPSIPIVALPENRKATDQATSVELDNTKLQAGKMAMITYTVTREDGQQPEITPYLGAPAHVIAVSPDGDELIHVHPMEGATQNTGMIHAIFPTEGDYRVWVQLLDHNVLKTMALSVNVSK
ncbi:MAG: hypothetical protein H7256_14885 [Bdellovibrio sp.]|nr:hypothetical protein [Bdellovibrio sp.]